MTDKPDAGERRRLLYLRRKAGASASQLVEAGSSPEGDCMFWRGAVTSFGYGTIRWEGRSEKVHRVAWIGAHGAIPDKLHVLHHCDNRRCVNVDHLFLGTNRDNMADKVAKGRQGRQRGETNGFAKLTAEIVRRIRQDKRTEKAIAADLGTCVDTIHKVKKRTRWGHVI